MEKIEWTKLDSIIDKAARDCVDSEDDILWQLGMSQNYYYGERIGMFKSGVEWAMRHYRMLGFKRITSIDIWQTYYRYD